MSRMKEDHMLNGQLKHNQDHEKRKTRAYKEDIGK